MQRKLRVVAALVTIVFAPTLVFTQSTVTPINSGPNPYQTIEGWAKMPEGRTWGSTSAVYPAADGKSVWVAERCGANTCVNSPNVDTVLRFDESGKLVRSFGAGMIIFPHGIFVDREDNVWVTDGQDNFPRAARGQAAAPAAAPPAKVIGHQVFKFSPDGKLLMTLGKPGGNRPGEPADPSSCYQPNAILVAPNGDIFVSEGHGGANARIVKFTKDGKLIKEIGEEGTRSGRVRSASCPGNGFQRTALRG